MKKSSFTALVLATISGVLFALGMCMALLPEWNAFTHGIIFGAIGIILGIATIFIWRKMENKKPLRTNKKAVLNLVVSILGALILGIGMCLCMVWNSIISGTLIGLVGIICLLSLIPINKGIK